MSEKIEEVMIKFGITRLQYTDPNDYYNCSQYNVFDTDGRVTIIEREDDNCEVQIIGATWVLARKGSNEKATLFTSITNDYALEAELLKSNAVKTFSIGLRERIKKLKSSFNIHSWNKNQARVSNYKDFQKYYSIFLDCTTEDPYTSETPDSIEKFIEEAKGECWAIVEFNSIESQVFLNLVTKDEKKLRACRASYI